MQHIFNPSAPKKATNLSVNSELLKAAKDCGINLSATLERALVDQVKQARKQKWLEENRDSIAAYNSLVEESGVFSDGTRSF